MMLLYFRTRAVCMRCALLQIIPTTVLGLKHAYHYADNDTKSPQKWPIGLRRRNGDYHKNGNLARIFNDDLRINSERTRNSCELSLQSGRRRDVTLSGPRCAAMIEMRSSPAFDVNEYGCWT